MRFDDRDPLVYRRAKPRLDREMLHYLVATLHTRLPALETRMLPPILNMLAKAGWYYRPAKPQLCSTDLPAIEADLCAFASVDAHARILAVSTPPLTVDRRYRAAADHLAGMLPRDGERLEVWLAAFLSSGRKSAQQEVVQQIVARHLAEIRDSEPESADGLVWDAAGLHDMLAGLNKNLAGFVAGCYKEEYYDGEETWKV